MELLEIVRKEIVPDAKTKKVSIYLTEKEFNKCKELAEQMDMTVPKFIRHCIIVYLSALAKARDK